MILGLIGREAYKVWQHLSTVHFGIGIKAPNRIGANIIAGFTGNGQGYSLYNVTKEDVFKNGKMLLLTFDLFYHAMTIAHLFPAY